MSTARTLRSTVRSTLLLTGLALVSSACGYDSLIGNYTGDVDCGDAGSVPMEFVILKDKGEGIYDSEAQISSITVDGQPADVRMEGDVLQTEDSGAQLLELSLVCGIIVEDGDDTEIDCSGFSEIAYDGEDTLSADVSGFLGTSADCSISLSR
jgi:hypothetical protein